MPKVIRWLGSKPEACDVCHKPLSTEFVDGRTVYGPWAMMCLDCFNTIGTGLGVGFGQLYRKQEDGAWKKISA